MNNDFRVTRDDFTRDFVTRGQIAPLVTPQSLFTVTHALFCIVELIYSSPTFPEFSKRLKFSPTQEA